MYKQSEAKKELTQVGKEIGFIVKRGGFVSDGVRGYRAVSRTSGDIVVSDRGFWSLYESCINTISSDDCL